MLFTISLFLSSLISDNSARFVLRSVTPIYGELIMIP